MGKMMPAAEFDANAIEFIEEIANNGGRLTITRPDQPELTVTVQARAFKPLVLGALKDVTTIRGNIVGPLEPDWDVVWDAKWDAEEYLYRDVEPE
jgi:hypothetical protein